MAEMHTKGILPEIAHFTVSAQIQSPVRQLKSACGQGIRDGALNRALSRQRGLTLNARALPAVQLETVLIRMQFAVWVLGATVGPDRKSVV